MLWLLDEDDLTEDDNMGISYVPMDFSEPSNTGPSWYPVEDGAKGTPMYSKNATGDVQVMITTEIKKVLNVVKGNIQDISGTIQVASRWAKNDSFSAPIRLSSRHLGIVWAHSL